jgi:hypothetical protein
MGNHESTHKVKETSKVKKIPCPNRRNIDLNEELYNTFDKALKDLRLELPILDVIQIPTLKKFMRYIVLNRNKKNSCGNDNLST